MNWRRHLTCLFGAFRVFSGLIVRIVVVGGVFVLELATSALQEQSLKRSGKRLFAAAPLHHLYQFRGIAESKIVVRLWIVSVLFAAMALAPLKIR